MMHEWRAGAVEPGGDRPDPETWESVTVPGRPADFAGSDAVAYRSTFEDPRANGDDHAMVVLEGVYAHARVWLNDTFLGEHDAYFEPLRLRLDGALEPENELVVECRRPDDRFGGSYESGNVPDELAVPGIWWDVGIETYGDHHVLDLAARPRVDDDGARFAVRTTVLAETALDDRLTFSVKPEGSRRGRGMMDRVPVAASAGERTTVEYTIDIRDPALWWPRDLGEQNRYVIRAKLGDDERSLTTGLRSINYDDEGLQVNGTPMTARGVGLLAAEPEDVRRAADLNATLVRPRAHVPSPAVYEAADDAGLLLWQDLPLTGPGPFDIERGRDLVGRLASTYDHHPSLAAISVHDDPVSVSDGPLGSGLLDRLRLRWRRFRADYDHEPARTVAAEIPQDFVAIPVVGPPGIDPDASALYPGWEYGDAGDVDGLFDRNPALGSIVGEYGAGSLSVEDPGDVAGFDREIHDYHVSGGLEASQAYQRSVIETVTERLRLREADVLVAASLRDLGDAGMGVLSRDGTPKQARDTLADAFEPVQTMLADPSPGVDSDVVVCNDLPTDVSDRLTWDVDGETGETDVTVDARGRATVTTLEIPADAETISLSLSDRSVSNTYRL